MRKEKLQGKKTRDTQESPLISLQTCKGNSSKETIRRNTQRRQHIYVCVCVYLYPIPKQMRWKNLLLKTLASGTIQGNHKLAKIAHWQKA